MPSVRAPRRRLTLSGRRRARRCGSSAGPRIRSVQKKEAVGRSQANKIADDSASTHAASASRLAALVVAPRPSRGARSRRARCRRRPRRSRRASNPLPPRRGAPSPSPRPLVEIRARPRRLIDSSDTDRRAHRRAHRPSQSPSPSPSPSPSQARAQAPHVRVARPEPRALARRAARARARARGRRNAIRRGGGVQVGVGSREKRDVSRRGALSRHRRIREADVGDASRHGVARGQGRRAGRDADAFDDVAQREPRARARRRRLDAARGTHGGDDARRRQRVL